MTTSESEQGIGVLPEEILLKILGHVRHSGTKDSFVSCLLVNKAWKKAGDTVQWRSLSITDANVKQLLVRMKTRDTVFSLVRHLTVYLHIPFPRILPNEDYWPVSDKGINHRVRAETANESVAPDTSGDADYSLCEFEHTLQLLATSIKLNMSSLTTFSFTIVNETSEPGEWCDCYVPGVLTSTLAKVLQAVPPSCTNLEFDTMGVDFGIDNESGSHLCVEVQKLMPQLKHLRLRLGCVCPSLIVTSMASDAEGNLQHSYVQSNLISCTINLAVFPRLYLRATLCGAYIDQCKEFGRLGRVESSMLGPEASIALSRCFRRANQVDGALPQLTKCNVFATQNFQDYGNADWDPANPDRTTEALCLFGEVHQIVHFDVLQNRTHLHPLQLFCICDFCAARIMMREYRGMMMKNCDDEAIISSYLHLERFIEQSWATTRHEIHRKPRALISSELAEEGYEWEGSEVISQAEYEEKYMREPSTSVDSLYSPYLFPVLDGIWGIGRAAYDGVLARRYECFDGIVWPSN